MRGRRAEMNQQIQELRNIIALQEQGKRFSTQLAEEKLSQNRSLLSQLHGTLQEDIHALDTAQKHDQRILSESCRAQKYLCGKTVQEAREKLRSSIFDRVNTCNALLHEVRQRIQTRDRLQWQLQQLLDVQISDKRHQEQVQTIRQLENSIEKMHMKIHAGQKLTALYLALRDGLKAELDSQLLHVELLLTAAGAYHGEVQDTELMASDARRACDNTKEDLAKLEAQVLAEEELRHRILSAQKVQTDRLWLKEASKKQEGKQRAQARYDSAVDFPSPLMQDSALGSQLQATRSQIEHKALVTAEVEKVKAAVQVSCIWDITSRLLAQKSTEELEQYIRACKEKEQALTDTLQELELKHTELKFHQPPSTTRSREAELQERLQQEQARLEKARAQYTRNQELLLQIENGVDNLVFRLCGVSVPEQDLPVEFKGVDEKLQFCRKKLQHLTQRVASLSTHSYNPDEDNETFVKVRNLMEKMAMRGTQNLQTPLKDTGSKVQAPSASVDEDQDLVLTREDIKKQGLCLMKSRMRSERK